MDPDAEGFHLRLPVPYDHITLTCPRLEDATDIPPILNNGQVYPWMGAGLPYPHQHEHALRWLKSVKAKCDIGQEQLGKAHDREETATRYPVCECPVRTIRETKYNHGAVYLGDCGIQRWRFSDVQDDKQRRILEQENEEKTPGDPTIIWTIGYYLAPSHTAQGIMSFVVKTLMNWTMVNMNVKHMRTTAIEGNEPSIRVLRKNGFTVEKTLAEYAVKNGQKVGLHVLEWKAPLPL